MLAYEETGKYISERHAEAASEGKLTAGRIAEIMNRQFDANPKIAAKELKPFAAEWHHGGFYKGNRGSTMGRTYFFAADTNLEELYKKVMAARDEAATIAAEPTVTRYFFAVNFLRICNPQKHYIPQAHFEIIECKSSDCFAKKTEISKEDYEICKGFEGRDLEAYESFRNFKERMAKNGSV